MKSYQPPPPPDPVPDDDTDEIGRVSINLAEDKTVGPEIAAAVIVICMFFVFVSCAAWIVVSIWREIL